MIINTYRDSSWWRYVRRNFSPLVGLHKFGLNLDFCIEISVKHWLTLALRLCLQKFIRFQSDLQLINMTAMEYF